MLYSSRKTTFWKCQCEFFKLRKNLSEHVLTPYPPTPLKGLLSADIYCTLIYQGSLAHVFPFSSFFFLPEDSRATAVIKFTKWVSNKQKCHLSSWKCHTKQSPPQAPPQSCSTSHRDHRTHLWSQSTTVVPLALSALPLAPLSNKTCPHCFIRSVLQTMLALLSIYYHPEAKSWNIQEWENTFLGFW